MDCVLYVADAYCGWCFGFAHRLAALERDFGHRIPFRFISGGLFVAERRAPFSALRYIVSANERIAGATGAVFGEAYLQRVSEGSFVMDSLDAATGLAALRRHARAPGPRLLARAQQAFYGDGLSLSDPQTFARIARAEGIDAEAVSHSLVDGSARTEALADFRRARQLGVHSYPTLLVSGEQGVTPLGNAGTPLEQLAEALERWLAVPA